MCSSLTNDDKFKDTLGNHLQEAAGACPDAGENNKSKLLFIHIFMINILISCKLGFCK